MSLISPSKRARSSSPSGLPGAGVHGEIPTPKAKLVHLSPTQTQTVITCSLPHAQTDAPLSFASYADFDAHHAATHSNRCLAPGCDRNFPTAHFLSLHIAENHDPIVATRRDRGERVYGCFVEGCDRVCSDWRKRRAHLVDKHGFPRDFDFLVVNSGIEGRRSLLRRPPGRLRGGSWGGRGGKEMGQGNRGGYRGSGRPNTAVRGSGRDTAAAITPSTFKNHDVTTVHQSKDDGDEEDSDDNDDDEDDENEKEEEQDNDGTNGQQHNHPMMLPFRRSRGSSGSYQGQGGITSDRPATKSVPPEINTKQQDHVDALSANLSALSFVPPSIRFGGGGGRGRGGGNRGATKGRGRRQ